MSEDQVPFGSSTVSDGLARFIFGPGHLISLPEVDHDHFLCHVFFWALQHWLILRVSDGVIPSQGSLLYPIEPGQASNFSSLPTVHLFILATVTFLSFLYEWLLNSCLSLPNHKCRSSEALSGTNLCFSSRAMFSSRVVQ